MNNPQDWASPVLYFVELIYQFNKYLLNDYNIQALVLGVAQQIIASNVVATKILSIRLFYLHPKQEGLGKLYNIFL
jgi:hypothetical protein